MATFTPEEVSKIRFHLGYPDADRIVSTMVGVREVVATIDQRLRDLNDTGKPRVMELVNIMDNLLQKAFAVSGNAEASKVGSVTLNPQAFQDLITQYDTWGKFLGNALDTPYNPFSKRGSDGQRPGTVSGTWCR